MLLILLESNLTNTCMTIAGFHLDTDQAPVLDELRKMLKNMLLILAK